MSCQSSQTPQAESNQQQHVDKCSCLLVPFPDEVIMLALDRILYYSGITQIQHLWNPVKIATATPCAAPAAVSLPPPRTVTCSTSTCSLIGKIDVPKCQSSKSSVTQFTSVRGLAAPKTSSLRCKAAPVSRLRPRTPRVDFANPVVDNRPTVGPSISTRVRQSLSACSIACRRLKVKLSTTAQNKDQRWVWTRLVSSANGCKVYEVYQNSNTSKKPWLSSDPKQQPIVVFLVMPSGYVVVFETVSSS